MPTKEGMMVEGEMLKRYTLRHGTFFGSYETAKEALAAFEHYDKVVRPVVDRRWALSKASPKARLRPYAPGSGHSHRPSGHRGRARERSQDDRRRIDYPRIAPGRGRVRRSGERAIPAR
jgi:hypothetical protein